MKLKQKLIAKLDKKLGDRRWYCALKSDAVLRTLVISAIGTAFTIGFATYNGVLGILLPSIWYGVFSVYLLVLVLQRLLIYLAYAIVAKKFRARGAALETGKLKIYLANGVVFVPIAVALSVIISLLVTSQKPIVSNTVLAIITAFYAFCKITVAIINFVKAKTRKDPIVQTVRNTALVDAVVSIILLESTLITAFGVLDRSMYVLIAVTGLAGCAFALYLGTYVIVVGAKSLRTSKTKEHPQD